MRNFCRSVLFTVLCISHTTFAGNDLCTTVNGEQGKCILFKNCKRLYSLITTKPVDEATVNYLRQSHCGFLGKEPEVCCSLDDHDDSPNLFIKDVKLPGLDVCGLFPSDRIIASNKAELGYYPWLALLEYQKPEGRAFHCGGVLISDQYVLTAAHCIADIPDDWQLIGVRLGEHDLKSRLDCVKEIGELYCADPEVDVEIEKRIVHEEYIPKDASRYNDIALLRLAKAVNFTDFIQPVCLPPENISSNVYSHLSLAGWGASLKTKAKGVKMQSWIRGLCNVSISNDIPMKVGDNQFCLMETNTYSSICYTDSGSAVTGIIPSYLPDYNHFVFGILSLESNDCNSKKTAIYTKIPSYVNWIIKNMINS